ncbi:MAG: RHS repeat-associated core domain-containing protein, partial [Acidobacteriota bacterium]
ERTHIFTVDGERLFTFDWNPSTGQITERWTLRDLDGSVLTTYETNGGNAGEWRWTQDYVYRDGTMFASRVRFGDGSIGVRDYVVDHLGTPRLIGDRFDGLQTQHFFGFGEPINLAASRSDPERKRFTGHERDLGTLGGAGGVQVELDYMRARFCSPWTARFLSVDPARESARPQRPQTWNRYSYAFNNPVTLVDPDGRAAEATTLQGVNLQWLRMTSAGRLVAGASPAAAVVVTAASAYSAGRVLGRQRIGEQTVDGHISDVLAGLIFHESDAQQEEPSSLDELVETADFIDKTRTGTRQYEKAGGFDQANEDFDRIVDPDTVKHVGEGKRVGRSIDGSSVVNVRPTSSGEAKSPTLEIRGSGNTSRPTRIKIRYNKPPS